MNLWPVTERELRLNARRARTYRSRMLTGFVVVLISLGMLYAGFARVLSPGSAGRGLFLILSCVGAAYVLLDGALMTADCLSQEKRDGTLGLLWLTGLSAREIVLGKLSSRVTHSAYCLLAAVPALAIALFLGGVTGDEVVNMAAALLNALFVSAAIGMFASAVCVQERRALSWALGGTLLLAVGLPALGWAVSLWRQTGTVYPAFLFASPAGAFLEVLGGGLIRRSSGYSFTESLACTHFLGWCILGAASVALSCTSDGTRDDNANGGPLGLPRARSGAAGLATKATARRRSIEQNPFIWLTEARRQNGLGMMPALMIFALAWGVGWTCGQGHWLEWPVYVGSVALLHLILVFFLVIQACRGPSQDRRERVLEMLLTTPAGADMYLPGRLLSLKRQCLGPLLMVLTIDLGLLAAGLWEIGPPNWEWLQWIGTFVALALKLILDLYVLSWVGVWQGLMQANTGRAVRRTFFYVLVLRWIVLLGLLALLGLVTGGRAFESAAGAGIGAAGYVVLLIMTALHFCALAMGELDDNLRLLALGESGKAPGAKLARA